MTYDHEFQILDFSVEMTAISCRAIKRAESPTELILIKKYLRCSYVFGLLIWMKIYRFHSSVNIFLRFLNTSESTMSPRLSLLRRLAFMVVQNRQQRPRSVLPAKTKTTCSDAVGIHSSSMTANTHPVHRDTSTFEVSRWRKPTSPRKNDVSSNARLVTEHVSEK